MSEADQSLKDQQQHEEDLQGYLLDMADDGGARGEDGGAAVVELTPEQQAALEEQMREQEAERARRLDDLCGELSKTRRDAINFRKMSGIEEEWRYCEDAYEGVDEASMNERIRMKQRPVGTFTIRDEEQSMRSTIVLNITKPYVNAFASKIIDMRLAVTDRAWQLKPTPIPEMYEPGADEMGLVDGAGAPVMVVDKGQQRQATALDLAKLRREKELAKATEQADRAQKQLDDWLVEGKFDKESRQVVDDMARIGTGVMKGPYPEKIRHSRMDQAAGAMVIVEKIKPRSRRIQADNLYPDPACGEDVHAGDYIWERDNITAKRIMELKGVPGYIDSQIDEVLKEGPRQAEFDYDADAQLSPDQRLRPFQIWFMHGQLKRGDLNAAGCECGEGDEEERFPVIITMINNHIIRAAFNPMDTGRFPYNVARCSRRKGYWAGIGICEELRTPQRMATGACRAMTENAGLSSRPILAIMQGLLVPADGNNQLYGGKIFVIPSNVDVREAQHALSQFQIESRQQENMNIIMFSLKMAEQVTGITMIMQGMRGQGNDVLGVEEIRNENSSGVARRVAKMFDDDLLEPHVGAYYDWMMQYGEDESIKGACTVQVLPAPDQQADKAALVEMTKLGQVPGSDVNPAKQYAEFAKSLRFDPKRLQFTEEEKAALEAKGAPQDPRIAAAQIKAQGDQQITQMELQAQQQLEQMRQQFEAAENERDRQNKLVIAAIDERMNSTQLTSEERQNLEKIKATLMTKVIEVRAQKELTRDAQVLDLHKHTQERKDIISKPVVEPAGRAPNGQAFPR